MPYLDVPIEADQQGNDRGHGGFRAYHEALYGHARGRL